MMYYGPGTEMCTVTLGAAAGAMVFDEPLEVSLIDQLLRSHQTVLQTRLAAHKQAIRAGQGAAGRLSDAEVKRASEQLGTVNDWLAQLSREQEET
jgi:hypothetical protein